MGQPIKIPTVEGLLNKHGRELVAALEKALPRKADATGELRNSIRFTIERFGTSYHFELRLADYYKWVDEGRKPGKRPPLDSIIKWIKDKRLVITKQNKLQTKTKGSKLQKISDDMQKSRQLAFAISNKIAKKGTKGTNFYSSTVPQWLEDLKIELPKALKRDVLVELKQL